VVCWKVRLTQLVTMRSLGWTWCFCLCFSPPWWQTAEEQWSHSNVHSGRLHREPLLRTTPASLSHHLCLVQRGGTRQDCGCLQDSASDGWWLLLPQMDVQLLEEGAEDWLSLLTSLSLPGTVHRQNVECRGPNPRF
jgi:hypothetical protein